MSSSHKECDTRDRTRERYRVLAPTRADSVRIIDRRRSDDLRLCTEIGVDGFVAFEKLARSRDLRQSVAGLDALDELVMRPLIFDVRECAGWDLHCESPKRAFRHSLGSFHINVTPNTSVVSHETVYEYDEWGEGGMSGISVE